MVLESLPFGLRDAVDDAVKLMGLRAHEKGLELACHIRPDVPDALVGDPGRLRQVILNLVGNAIKFTDAGDVVVDVECERVEDAEAWLRFTVSDTGIGIAPEKQWQIFGPFVQADASTSRRFGGTGLGLTISTQLVELMGGRMWVDSEHGPGQPFPLHHRLRARPAGGGRRRAGRRRAARPAGAGRRRQPDRAARARRRAGVRGAWSPVTVGSADEAMAALGRRGRCRRSDSAGADRCAHARGRRLRAAAPHGRRRPDGGDQGHPARAGRDAAAAAAPARRTRSSSPS